MAHRNARLTVHGRLLLIERVVVDGRPVAHVAPELGISRATGYKWLARWRAEGPAGLLDRSSRPHTSPAHTDPVSKTAIPMPYPHARADCDVCGRYDADTQATFLGRGQVVQPLRR